MRVVASGAFRGVAMCGVMASVFFIRMIVMKDVSARIERGEVAAGVYLASISLAVGMLNAACMTS